MATDRERLLERIVVDPQILVGKPVIRGTRIAVALVLRHLEERVDLDDLFAAFPRLTLEDVQACLAYARAAVERQRRRAHRRAPSGMPAASA